MAFSRRRYLKPQGGSTAGLRICGDCLPPWESIYLTLRAAFANGAITSEQRLSGSKAPGKASLRILSGMELLPIFLSVPTGPVGDASAPFAAGAGTLCGVHRVARDGKRSRCPSRPCDCLRQRLQRFRRHVAGAISSGLETWFSVLGRSVAPAVSPRWKMALITWLALLPQVILSLLIPAEASSETKEDP
jgi:hypothetical protein